MLVNPCAKRPDSQNPPLGHADSFLKQLRVFKESCPEFRGKRDLWEPLPNRYGPGLSSHSKFFLSPSARSFLGGCFGYFLFFFCLGRGKGRRRLSGWPGAGIYSVELI